MTVMVALLRGINVGGRNKLPMADLCEIAASIGCTEPRTYIQSGNLVCGWPEDASTLAPALGSAIASETELTVDVVVREAPEFGAVVDQNPFLLRGEDPGYLHVAFADGEDRSSFVDRLAAEFLPDEAVLLGEDMYLFLPNGVGRSKLAAAVGRSVQPRYTVRNWRTVTTLAKMLRDE